LTTFHSLAVLYITVYLQFTLYYSGPTNAKETVRLLVCLKLSRLFKYPPPKEHTHTLRSWYHVHIIFTETTP